MLATEDDMLLYPDPGLCLDDPADDTTGTETDEVSSCITTLVSYFEKSTQFYNLCKIPRGVNKQTPLGKII